MPKYLYKIELNTSNIIKDICKILKKIRNYPYTIFKAGYREIYIKESGLKNYFYTILKAGYRKTYIKRSRLRNHFYTIYKVRYKKMHIKGSKLKSFTPLQNSLAEVVYKSK